jgi:hypothetical protein
VQPVYCGVVIVRQSFAHGCLPQQLFVSAHMARYDEFSIPIMGYGAEPLVTRQEGRGLVRWLVGGRHAEGSVMEGASKLCV